MKNWEIGEIVTARFFGFDLTSGSGRGVDAGDSQNLDWVSDTKTTEAKSYSINFSEFKRMKQKAALRGKNFFIDVLPVVDDNIIEEDGIVMLSRRLFRALLNNQKEE